MGPLRPAAQTGSWKKKNKAPSEGGRRSRSAPAAGKAEAKAPGALPSPPATLAPDPLAQRRPPPPALAPLGPREAASPKGRAAGRRGSGGGGAGEDAGGGAGRGAGAPLMSEVGPSTDCHPAAISLCHGSGLLATAASPAAPSRASRRGLNSTRRSPARCSHTKEALRGRGARREGTPRGAEGRRGRRLRGRMQDAEDLTLLGNSWKWLPPQHRRGLRAWGGRSPPRGC